MKTKITKTTDGYARGVSPKTELITLRNEFHGTNVRVRAPVGSTPWEAWTDLSEATRARVRRRLCGMEDCHCGTVWMTVP